MTPRQREIIACLAGVNGVLAIVLLVEGVAIVGMGACITACALAVSWLARKSA